MKVLILSVCGKTGEADDPRFINLYLASLKKHVIPYIETKVILLNNSNVENSKDGLVYKRVEDFGLQEYVDVRSIHEMELPQKSLEFMKNMHWAGKIGLNMNMMLDYSKNNNFFDADWIVHTDTDSEFLPNFVDNLEALSKFATLNDQVVVSLSGDTYPYNFRHKEKEFLIIPPKRADLYNEENVGHEYNYYDVKMNIRDEPYYLENDKMILNVQQQKVRNDFFAMTRSAALHNTFNWSTSHYPSNLKARDKESEAQVELENAWNEYGSPNFLISINHDKGSLVQYQLQEGFNQIAKVQLRLNADMMRHFGGGYCNGESFPTHSASRLRKDYPEFVGIWEGDYV
jgi:hypothetical protein